MSTQLTDVFEILGEILKPEPAILQHLEDKAKRAHNNISFSPDRRGEQMIKDYSEELSTDMQELKEGGANDESIADYKNRYERFFTSYLHAKSNTFSVMITGAGNFPVRKHAKANRSEKRHYELFREWRIRAKKAIIRKMQPVKTFISELDRYRNDLAAMQRNHEKMKQGNKLVAKAIKTGENITDTLINDYGIAPHMVDWCVRFGFNLTNNNANMKRVEQRIKELEQKETLRLESPEKEYTFKGGKVVINYEADRIQIFFDTRPTQSELSEWKAKGLNSFNWSPSVMAWQRKITNNAIYATKHMLKGLI